MLFLTVLAITKRLLLVKHIFEIPMISLRVLLWLLLMQLMHLNVIMYINVKHTCYKRVIKLTSGEWRITLTSIM